MADQPSEGERQREALKHFLKVFVRWVLIALIVVVLAVGIYAGTMIVYGNIVDPLRANTSRLSLAETRQAQAETDLSALQAQVKDLQAQHQADAKTLAGLASDQKTSQQTLAEHTLLLGRLDSLAEQVDELAGTSDGMQKTLAAAEAPMANLRRDLQLVKAMELLSRSRMYLVQSNFGLARQDVAAARQILTDLKVELPAYQTETMDVWLLRLDLALDNLPGSPVTAADDLEILWRLIVAGLPPSVITVTPSITPSFTQPPSITPSFTQPPSITPSVTPADIITTTPTPVFTPTAVDTGTPTPTPAAARTGTLIATLTVTPVHKTPLMPTSTPR